MTYIMTRGTPISVTALGQSMTDATDEDGIFVPPLVLLAGEIALPFDSLEALKATIAAVTPLMSNDKRLKELVDTVSELLKTPWVQTGSGGIERLSAQIKQAFTEGNRALPQNYLDDHITHMLLEQRRYQRRTMSGKPLVRALLCSATATQQVPAYLSDALARDLPMYQRFPARLIAELRPRVDQYESHAYALRIVALGRVLSEKMGS